MDESEQEQITRILQGDRDAYGLLVETYQGMAFAVALNLTGSYSDSQDVIQEAFIQAYRRLRTLSDPARFGAWLCTITRRIALRFVREKARQSRVVDSATHPGDAIPANGETPEEAYARRELHALLWKEVGELPPCSREAVLLYYVRGFTISRAARFLGISDGALKMRLTYARTKLRQSLEARVETELRRHQPSRKTRNAIVAALSLGLGASASSAGAEIAPAGSGVPHAVMSKKVVIAAACVVVCILGGLGLFLGTRIFNLAPPNRGTGALPPDLPQVALNAEGDGEPTEPAAAPRATPATSGHRTITGRVSAYAAGSPIAGIRLTASGGDGKTADTWSDSNGVFVLGPLAAGRYDLTIDPGPNGVRYFVPFGLRRFSVTVETDDVTGLDVRLVPAGSMGGVVLNDRGIPVPAATVELSHVVYRSDSARLQTDEDGTFLFSGLYPTTNYRLTCTAPGHTRATVNRLDLPFGRSRSDVVVKLTEGTGATIRGRVLTTEGEPVPYVVIGLHREDRFQPVDVATTDTSGRFSFVNAQPGRVRVAAKLYGRRTHLVIAANEVREHVDFRVAQKLFDGTVSGVLRDGHGEPLAGAMLHAQAAQADDPTAPAPGGPFLPSADLAHAVTDGEGRFVLGNLKPETCVEILYEIPNGPLKPTDAVAIPVPATQRAVTYMSSEETVRLITVRGRVVDRETGEPVPWFRVGISGRSRRTTWVYDRDGRFTLERVRCYRRVPPVVVDADGYPPATARPAADETESAVDVQVRLVPGGTVTGQVLDTAGNPIAGARVFLRDRRESFAVSNETGRFILTGCPEGTRQVLYATHADYVRSASPFFAITRGGVTRDRILRLRNGATVQGAVRDTGGAPVSFTPISLLHGNSLMRTECTDHDGVYCIDRIAPGTYSLRLDSDRYEPRQVTLADGAVEHIDFGPSPTEKEAASKDATGMLTGSVTTPSGTPAAGVSVELLADGAYVPRTPVARTRTDQTGKFAFENVLPGCYTLRSHSPAHGSGERTLTVKRDETPTGTAITLVTFGRLTVSFGEVPATMAQPAAGFVFLMDAAAHVQLRGGMGIATDEGIAIKLDHVPAGSYRVGALLGSGTSLQYGTPIHTPVQVTPGEEVTVTLDALPTTGLHVAVLDGRREPVEDFRITISTPDGAPFPILQVAGNKAKAVVTPGTVRVVVTVEGQIRYDGTVVVEDIPEEPAVTVEVLLRD